MRTLVIARTISLALLSILFVAAHAGLIDGTVLINRAANNRTITVKYDGVSAALVEMRVNGESVATRAIDDKSPNGETNFALNPASLVDGDNTIEIRMYDSKGKLLAHERTSVFVDRKPTGPVFLEKPKSGSTIQGAVQIELGMRQNLRNLYVSFFLDDAPVHTTNIPPYAYLWDTTRVANGWHEIQAWVVDSTHSTFKSEKMRLYVNNPSGRTTRMNPLDPSTNEGVTTGNTAGAKTVEGAGGLESPVTTAVPPLGGAAVSENVGVATTLADSAGTKSPEVGKGDATGQRTLLPTGTRVAVEPKTTIEAGSLTPENPKKLAKVDVTFGSRVFDAKTFEMTLNGKPIVFDVAPMVVEGVPFAPFRHLFEEVGGEVKWIHDSKTVEAKGLGLMVMFQIGQEFGLLNGTKFLFERTPFIQSGRTVVPLSFVSKTLSMDVEYDPNTGHVLITNSGKN
jgi:hypothetical protein